MQSFCANCGMPLDGTVSFCTRCGAMVQAHGSPETSRPFVASPATGSGGPAIRLVLILLGTLAGLTVLGIGSCLYIGYRVKEKLGEVVKVERAGEPGQTVTFKTPEGEIKLGERRDESAGTTIGGVPTYPGSIPSEEAAEVSLGGMSLISGQEYWTADSVEKVVRFYRENLGSNLSVIESQGEFQLALLGTEGRGTTTISIKRDEDARRTKIYIAHLGK